MSTDIDGVSVAAGLPKPVAYRVKDFADGWILCHTLEVAEYEADGQCLIQPLYASPPRESFDRTIEALRTIADIAEGSKTANSLPNIAKIARTELAISRPDGHGAA